MIKLNRLIMVLFFEFWFYDSQDNTSYNGTDRNGCKVKKWVANCWYYEDTTVRGT